MSKVPNVWRMFADKDHFQWQYWLKTGLMSLGWGTRTGISNLDEYDTWEQLAEDFRPYYDTNKEARFAAKRLWRFTIEANNGDIVFVYDESSILGIGLIVGKVEFVNEDEMCKDGLLFAYRRDVDWLSTRRRKLNKKQMKQALMLHEGSIFKLEDKRLIEGIIKWSKSDIQDVEDIGDIEIELMEDDDELDIERVGAGTRRKRNRVRARKFLQANDFQCQICGLSIILPDGRRYAEVHHIQPLGRPDNGADRMVNMICLCPNHHAEMDRGAFYIDMHTRRVVHFDAESPIHGTRIRSTREKWPASQYLKYQKEDICKSWTQSKIA